MPSNRLNCVGHWKAFPEDRLHGTHKKGSAVWQSQIKALFKDNADTIIGNGILQEIIVLPEYQERGNRKANKPCRGIIMKVFFETEHLVVRNLEPEDTEQLYANHAEEKVRKWFPNECYSDLNEAKEAIGFFRDCVLGDRLPFVLAIQLKKTGELIGDTGVSEVEGKPDAVEIGYQICDRYSGRGLATEALKAMTKFSLDKFNAVVSYGRVVHGNEASVRVLEKGGYTFVNEEFGAEDDPYGNGMLVFAYKKEGVLVKRFCNGSDCFQEQPAAESVQSE